MLLKIIFFQFDKDYMPEKAVTRSAKKSQDAVVTVTEPMQGNDLAEVYVRLVDIFPDKGMFYIRDANEAGADNVIADDQIDTTEGPAATDEDPAATAEDPVAANTVPAGIVQTLIFEVDGQVFQLSPNKARSLAILDGNYEACDAHINEVQQYLYPKLAVTDNGELYIPQNAPTTSTPKDNRGVQSIPHIDLSDIFDVEKDKDPTFNESSSFLETPTKTKPPSKSLETPFKVCDPKPNFLETPTKCLGTPLKLPDPDFMGILDDLD